MALGDFFKRQFSTVIEWQDQQPDLLWYRFPISTSALKNNSKLLVSPGQGCLLVYEGKVREIFAEEGLFNIKTDNRPFITNLLKLGQLAESEHKLHLYFYRKADSVNQAWGTSSTIKYIDSAYNIPVALGMYGNYSMQITDPALFFSEILGSRAAYTTDDARALLLSRIPQVLISYLAQSKLSYVEIDSQLEFLSAGLQEKLNSAFTKLGLSLKDFRIQGTSFDRETQKRIGKIADVTAENLAAAAGGLTYLEMEKLRALRDAARNESGLAGAGLLLGFGAEIGKTMDGKSNMLSEHDSKADPILHLQQLKVLLDEHILTQEEFDHKKREILNKI